MSYAVSFVERLPIGLVVAVSLPPPPALSDDGSQGDADQPAAWNALRPEERAIASGLLPRRRISWAGGRLAMRHALAHLGADAPPIETDDRGAPRLPPGLVGSISHKEALAVALLERASASDAVAFIGVDVEAAEPRTVDIARHVLTADENAIFAALPPAERGAFLMRTFSLKESIYKALDPYVRRYVAFQEVALRFEEPTASEGDRAEVDFRLKGSEGPFVAELHWRRRGPFVLSCARIRRR